jgi:hypothetical protein
MRIFGTRGVIGSLNDNRDEVNMGQLVTYDLNTEKFCFCLHFLVKFLYLEF